MLKFYIGCCSFPVLVTGCAGPNSVGIMGAGFPIPLPGTSKFDIASTPPGVDIFLNGKFKGKTPLAWDRTLLLQTIQKIEIKASLAEHEDGIVSGINYTSKPSHTQNAEVSSWGARYQIFFDLPVRPEFKLKRAWQQALSNDTIQAYEQFLKTHPDAEQGRIAMQRLGDLRAIRANEEWCKAKAASTIAGYRYFLKKYPQTEQASKAKAQLEELEFERAVQSVSEEELQRFINFYPDSDYTAEARRLRTRLQDIQSRIASDPVVAGNKIGIQVSEITARLGKPASGGMLIEDFSVVGESLLWQLYPDNSRYYGIVQVETDRAGKVTKFGTGIGIRPSPAEIAVREQKASELAERRRASNKKISVTIVNRMAANANVSINGERIGKPMSLGIFAALVPGSHRQEESGQSDQMEFLPGDYSLSLNGKTTNIVIPDRHLVTR